MGGEASLGRDVKPDLILNSDEAEGGGGNRQMCLDARALCRERELLPGRCWASGLEGAYLKA